MVGATNFIQFRLNLTSAAQGLLETKCAETFWIPFAFEHERIDILCDYIWISRRKRKVMFDRDQVDRVCREIARDSA